MATNIEAVLRANSMLSFPLVLNVRTLGADGISHEKTVTVESVQEVVDLATTPRTSATMGVKITSAGVTLFPSGVAAASHSRYHLPDTLKGPKAQRE